MVHDPAAPLTAIAADRLRKLLGEGMLTRTDDPSHKQKAIYSLTEKAIALVPVFAYLGAWGRRHLPASEELSVRARVLEEGGPEMWEKFMAELREEHLGLPPGGRFEPGDGSVAAVASGLRGGPRKGSEGIDRPKM